LHQKRDTSCGSLHLPHYSYLQRLFAQEERNARSEEEATLRGTIKALEAQVVAAEAGSKDAGERRLRAADDANRVREELGRTIKQRDQLQDNLARLQDQLARWVSLDCEGQ